MNKENKKLLLINFTMHLCNDLNKAFCMSEETEKQARGLI